MTTSDSQDFDLQLLYSHNFPQGRSKIITGLDMVHGSKETNSFNLAVTYDALLKQYTSYTLGALSTSYDITTKVSAPRITSTTRRARVSGRMPPNAAAARSTITGATIFGPPNVSAAYAGRSIGVVIVPTSAHQSSQAVPTSTT